eukprot:TRINITY_DN18561_c0_g1_i2.p1 TRINITY_DN18561_c0_g1~~TRINITY_DN18561_c0_g1_i2.p1  ORF type:complete len:321 (-),score=23.66 TRINITY_DN18561_c0_g1_i2:153-1115(-)
MAPFGAKRKTEFLGPNSTTDPSRFAMKSPDKYKPTPRAHLSPSRASSRMTKERSSIGTPASHESTPRSRRVAMGPCLWPMTEHEGQLVRTRGARTRPVTSERHPRTPAPSPHLSHRTPTHRSSQQDSTVRSSHTSVPCSSRSHARPSSSQPMSTARAAGIEPFLVTGDPGAAGLLPRVPQSLVSGMMNKLRKDPQVAAMCVSQGLIRAAPDPSLFHSAAIATPDVSSGLEPEGSLRRPMLPEGLFEEIRQQNSQQGVESGLVPRQAMRRTCREACQPTGWSEARSTPLAAPRRTLASFAPPPRREYYQTVSEWRRTWALS